jgi:hypothetical protein
MATIDLTLDSFIVPRISTFSPPWGTTQTDPDHAGLSTQEAVNNIMMAFNRMRPVTVTENSATTGVQADASLILTGGITSLTLGQGAYRGVELKIFNDAAAVDVQILNGSKTITAKKGDCLDLRWNGTEWRIKTGKSVGDLIVQYPSERSPVDRCLEGTWVPWSYNASLYAVSGTSPLTGVYADFIADWKTYRHDVWSLNTDGTVATQGTKKYASPAGYTVVERQELQPDWTVEDLAEGTQISGGTYNNRYIWQKIAFAGLFFGVEDIGYEGGGKRPTFISGGVQGGRIPNIPGDFSFSSYNNSQRITSNQNRLNGPFYKKTTTTGSFVTGDDVLYTDRYAIGFDPSLVVPTGPDNAPGNLSARFWRRVA